MVGVCLLYMGWCPVESDQFVVLGYVGEYGSMLVHVGL